MTSHVICNVTKFACVCVCSCVEGRFHTKDGVSSAGFEAVLSKCLAGKGRLVAPQTARLAQGTRRHRKGLILPCTFHVLVCLSFGAPYFCRSGERCPGAAVPA